MLEELGEKVISYVQLQQEADNKHIFGNSTKTQSAIRTVFPLLKKIEFVNYDAEFKANTCFTKLGKFFVLTCRTINNINITEDDPYKQKITPKLLNIKKNIQKEGLIRMYHNPQFENHNIWIALKLFKELKVLHWNEYLYALYIIKQNKDIGNAIKDIRTNKKEIDESEFFNEKNDKLPNTCFCYIRSFLEEAGLIYNISKAESQLTEEAPLFYSKIGL